MGESLTLFNERFSIYKWWIMPTYLQVFFSSVILLIWFHLLLAPMDMVTKANDKISFWFPEY